MAQKCLSSFQAIICLLLLAGVALMSLPSLLQAQVDTGSIYGVVADASGAVIPGAKVSVVSERTGAVRETVTGNSGRYEVTELRVGSYTVTVEMVGFKSHTVRGVTVAVTEATRADITLQVGDRAETIEVSATSVATVETRDTTLGDVIEERRIDEMPLNGRNFLQLSYFVPGVTVNYRPINLKGSPTDVPGAVQLLPWVNGTRNTMSAVLIDGALNNDPVLNTAAIVPVPDAIQEFKIQTNLYTAEFGQGGGSVISIVTKSGGQDFHGTAYYFGRNEALDARNPFLTETSKLRRHQFGVSAGGPIKLGGPQDNSFFFATYEGLRLDEGQILGSIVPSLAQRSGDFSDLPFPLQDPIGGCITNNIINPACMDPVAVNLIDTLWPEPNTGTNGFNSAPLRTLDRDQLLVKVDHRTGKHMFSGRYVIDDGFESVPVGPGLSFGFFTGDGVPGFPVTNPSRFQNLVFSDTYVTSARSVNVFRFSYLRASYGNNILADRQDPADFGFTYPVLSFPSLPGFTVAGFAITGPPGQKDFTKGNNIFQWGDTFSYETGSHSLRFGGELRRSRADINTGNFTPGFFLFTGAVTFNALADYLFGASTFVLQVEGDAERDFRSTSYSLFFQDSYRMTPNFTFNFGLRWEVLGPFGDPHIHRVGHPRLHTFIPGRQSTWAPDLPTGIVLGGFDEGVRETIIATDYNNLAPRLGFAWDPFGRGKTSIRGGYGIFYDASILDGVINSTDGTPSIRPAVLPFFPGPGSMADPFFGNSPFTPPITFPIPTTTDLGPTIVDPDQRTPYVQQWNLTVQQEIPGAMLFEVGYVGTKGTKLTGHKNQGQACLASVANPCNGETTNTLANLGARRPFPGLTNLDTVSGEFTSNYHGLQAGLTRRLDQGLAFQLSYTWSKAIDYTSKANVFIDIEGQPGAPQDSSNLEVERGLAAFDARHRFVANFLYELPFARQATGAVKHLLGGWQVNGILTLQSGSPFTVFDSSQPSNTGGFGDRPDVVCDPELPSGQRSVDQWFDTSCFQSVRPDARFGTAGRNILTTDGIATMDFSIFKTIQTSETTRFEFRAEFFNLFNHANFGTPISDISSGFFGRVLDTAVDERQIQFALKFVF